jgi:hypothetical protein
MTYKKKKEKERKRKERKRRKSEKKKIPKAGHASLHFSFNTKLYDPRISSN